MSLVTICKKARKGTLEVEDLLKEARLATPGLGQLLDDLSQELMWTRGGVKSDGSLVTPWKSWAEIISAYSKSGLDGLSPYIIENECISFILGLVEELKTAQALSFILEAYSVNIANPDHNLDVSLKIASTLNLLLSFKNAPYIDPVGVTKVETFLFSLNRLARSESERALTLLALRGVGTEEAIKLIETGKPFAYPWAETPSISVRAIRKRLRAQ